MSEKEFLALIRENQGIIFKLVSLYANDAEEKKDFYQEILLNAWKGWPAFRREAKFSTWLYRLCLNTILTLKRRAQIIEYNESVEEISPGIEASAILSENSEQLKAAIRRLPDTDKAIVSMHLDGFDNGEIATVMGITLNHVSVKLHRVKQQLSNLLKQSQ